MSFGKKRSEVTSVNTSNLSYKGLFTGTGFVTPVCFNPSVDQIRAYKNLKPEFEVREPEYLIKSPVKDEDGEIVEGKTIAYRKVSLLCSYDPNALLRLNEKAYSDKFFVNFEFRISSRLTINKAGTKLMIIDGKLNQFWIDIDTNKLQSLYAEIRTKKTEEEKQEALEDVIAFVRKAAKKAQDTPRATRSPLDDIDLKTVRFCREGEQILYKTIYNMSDMYIPKKLSTDEAKKLKKENEAKYEEYVQDYESTDMTFISTFFDDLVAGNYDSVNDVIFNTKKEYFEQDGHPCKLGVFFGVRDAGEGKYYQGLFSPANIYGDNYTFRLPYKTTLPKPIDGLTAHGKTLMPKKMAQDIAGVDSKGGSTYGYRDIWQDSFEFKEFTPEDFTAPETVIETKSSTAVDDLPF